MTPEGMDHLVELLESAIDYIGFDQPELVPALAHAKAVVGWRAARERAELVAQGWDAGRGDLATDLGRADSDRRTQDRDRIGAPASTPDRHSARPGFDVSPGGVRAALEALLDHHAATSAGRAHDDARCRAATELLGRLPALPGRVGEVLGGVLVASGPELTAGLAELAGLVGWAPPGTDAPVAGADPGRVAALVDARDAAFDRAVDATLRRAQLDALGRPDPGAAADAKAWTAVHEQAAQALARVGAAGAPRRATVDPGPELSLEEAVSWTPSRGRGVGSHPDGLGPSW